MRLRQKVVRYNPRAVFYTSGWHPSMFRRTNGAVHMNPPRCERKDFRWPLEMTVIQWPRPAQKLS